MIQTSTETAVTEEQAAARRPQDIALAILDRIDQLERRLEQRLADLRARQEEDLMLVKALSCQLRERVARAERRGRSV